MPESKIEYSARNFLNEAEQRCEGARQATMADRWHARFVAKVPRNVAFVSRGSALRLQGRSPDLREVQWAPCFLASGNAFQIRQVK